MEETRREKISRTMAASGRRSGPTPGPWRASGRSPPFQAWLSSLLSRCSSSRTPRCGARYRPRSPCWDRSSPTLTPQASSGSWDLSATRKTSRLSSLALLTPPWTEKINANFGDSLFVFLSTRGYRYSPNLVLEKCQFSVLLEFKEAEQRISVNIFLNVSTALSSSLSYIPRKYLEHFRNNQL